MVAAMIMLRCPLLIKEVTLMNNREELIKCIGDIPYGALKDDLTHTPLKEILHKKLIYTIADAINANGWERKGNQT